MAETGVPAMATAAAFRAEEERVGFTTNSPKQDRMKERHKQSPINITKGAVDHDSNLKASHLKFSYTMGDIKTVEVILTAPHLPGTYELWELHAHWGPDKNAGSEHLLEGKAFPAE
ncbi:unnamed protein product, partial [Gongylonema pulchrum]|uniref:Alpha-carbonic anhydrase domain-containing protein n=1 Tax=Gongylonema pulchrum TaxID=637853 RepID=A0A183D382_9BILA